MISIKNYLIKPTPSFEKEFKKIYEHLAFTLQEPIVAKNFYTKVKKEIYSLRYFPERYTKLFSYNDKKRNLRRFPINKYIVLYEVDHNTRTSFYSSHFP